MTLALEHLAPPDSAVARWDPRWKLAALVLAAGCVAALGSVGPLAVAFAASLLLAWWGRLPGRWYRVRIVAVGFALLPFLLILPFTVDRGGPVWDLGPVRVSAAGVVAAVAIILKALAIVTLMLVILATAPLHTTLHAAQRLHVPGLLVQLTLLGYRYIFLLADELARIRTALRVRGFRNRMSRHAYRTAGQVTGTLLVRGAERAERVAQAMRCRGFDGRFRSLAEFRTKTRDVVLFVLVVAGSAGLIAWDIR